MLIDTNIAIHLRDVNDEISMRIAGLDDLPAMSIVTSVELEGGIYTRPDLAKWRRARVDEIYRQLTILPFDAPCAAAYGFIVEAAGFSRRKIVDRMIAATALTYDLTLITMNGDDFRDIPGLKLEVWA